MGKTYRDGRVVVFVNMAFLLLGWAVFVVLPVEVSAADLVVTGAFAIASILTIWIVPAVVRNTLRPLPPEVGEVEARRLSLGYFAPAVGFAAVAAAIVPYIACVVGLRTPLCQGRVGHAVGREI